MAGRAGLIPRSATPRPVGLTYLQSDGSGAGHHGTHFMASVTTLDYPLSKVGKLPGDLLSPFNLAVNSATLAQQILQFARLFLGSQSSREDGPGFAVMVEPLVETIRSEYPYHDVLGPVLNELVAVSEPASLFGSICAHQAALDFARKVLNHVWSAVDPIGWAECIPTTPNPWI